MVAAVSALPKAVRSQVAKANKIADEYYKQLNAGTPDPNDAPAGGPPAGDPPNGGAPAGDPPAGNAEPPAGSGAAASSAPPPPPADWETKYKTLQGKYNAEVPRLTNQVREQGEMLRNMHEQLTATQNLLASLSSQQQTPQASATPPAAAKRLVTDEEIKTFGPDLFDFIKRAAAESVLPAVDSRVDARIAPVTQKVEQVASTAATTAQRTAKNDRNSVLALLAAEVPKWAEQNEDPAFLEWLDQTDPYSGHPRGALLEQAFKAYDGPRVVAFFRGYLNENAALNPPQPSPAAGAAPKPQKELADFVAPGAPKTGAAVAPDGSGKRVWTRAEIGRFYEDARAGKYRTKMDEYTRTEKDIFAAQREGRVRN